MQLDFNLLNALDALLEEGSVAGAATRMHAGVPAAADLRYEVIHQDRMSVAVHLKHPWTKGRLTAKRFSQGQHVIVSRRGRLRDAVDAKLEALGLRRQVLAALPTSTAALSFVRDCESAVTIPELMCRTMADLFRLRLLRLPLDLDPIPLMSTWHLRYDRDPTHIWIRTQVREVIQSTLQNQRLIT